MQAMSVDFWDHVREAERIGADLASVAEAFVDVFNASVPVGSRVTVRMDNGQVLATRTRRPARLANNGLPVVWLAGIAGFYRLDRVRLIRPESPLAGTGFALGRLAGRAADKVDLARALEVGAA